MSRGPSVPEGKGWVCFHCWERFTSYDKAAKHFGSTPRSKPACLVKHEEGMLAAYRRMEGWNDRLRLRVVELMAKGAGIDDTETLLKRYDAFRFMHDSEQYEDQLPTR